MRSTGLNDMYILMSQVGKNGKGKAGREVMGWRPRGKQNEKL